MNRPLKLAHPARQWILQALHSALFCMEIKTDEPCNIALYCHSELGI